MGRGKTVKDRAASNPGRRKLGAIPKDAYVRDSASGHIPDIAPGDLYLSMLDSDRKSVV